MLRSARHLSSRLASPISNSRNLIPFTAVNMHFSTSALDWLASYTNYEQKGVPKAAGTDTADGFDLGRVHRLLTALGSPHVTYPSVHVAGTKGKGSTVAMISSILQKSGYKTGAYTSPHIISLLERMSVDSTPIPDEQFGALVATHKATIESVQKSENGGLSHFEIITALAFRYFADAGVDVAVIETGLGGSRDATNILPAENIAASVITAIGNDHAEALGGSIHSIAAAKAGIIKPKRPVIVGRQPEGAAVLSVIQQQAEEVSSPIRSVIEEVQCSTGEIKYENGVLVQHGVLKLSLWAASVFRAGASDTNILNNDEASSSSSSSLTTIDLPIQLSLVGGHQIENAATAVTAAACLASLSSDSSNTIHSFSKISIDSITAGLEAATLPGRFQICQIDATGAGGSGTITAVLDGAHTPESAAALTETVRAGFPTAPVALVLAMASDKDHRGVCAELRDLNPCVAVFTDVPVAGGNSRSAAPGQLVGAWQAAAMLGGGSRKNKRLSSRPVRARELIQASLKAAVARATAELDAFVQSSGSKEQGIVVVTGSLHAVGTALKDLNIVVQK